MLDSGFFTSPDISKVSAIEINDRTYKNGQVDQETVTRLSFGNADPKLDMLQQHITNQQMMLNNMQNAILSQQTMFNNQLQMMQGAMYNTLMAAMQAVTSNLQIESNVKSETPIAIEDMRDDVEEVTFTVVKDEEVLEPVSIETGGVSMSDSVPMIPSDMEPAEIHKVNHMNSIPRFTEEVTINTKPRPKSISDFNMITSDASYLTRLSIISKYFTEVSPISLNTPGMKKGSLHSNIEDDDMCTIDYDCIKSRRLEMYRHDTFYKEFGMIDPNGKPYLEAFDIEFEPMWKRIVGEDFGGLTASKMCLVRLITKNETGAKYFLSLYVNDTTFSSYFSEYKVPTMVYSGECWNNEVYIPIMSSLEYAWRMNGCKPFVILEQIVDRKFEAPDSLMLSGQEPKTEIREEINIFKLPQRVRKVYTNYRQPKFLCQRPQNDPTGFEISKFRF